MRSIDGCIRQEGRSTPERLRLVPLNTSALGSSAATAGQFIVLLVAVVAVTLLIGCANLANLLLARVAGRRREFAVRLALGAGRADIVGQTLVETTILSGMGGVAGLGVAFATLRLLEAYQLPGDIPIAALGLSLDRPVLAATALLSLATGLAFGAAPAWRASRAGLVGSPGEGARGATAHGGVRSTLLAFQVALCSYCSPAAACFSGACSTLSTCRSGTIPSAWRWHR